MSAQLYDLLDMADRGAVVVRVLPLTCKTVHLVGLFMIYASDDEDIALYIERGLDDEILYAPDRIHQHRRYFEQV